ncbi:MAG: diguanylate cyclase [Anaerolineae bacterium]
MKRKLSQFGFTPAEHRISALPSTIAGMVILAVAGFSGGILWPESLLEAKIVLVVAVLGILYLGLFNWFLVSSPSFGAWHTWMNAVLTSAGLLLLTYTTNDHLDLYLGFLLILAVVSSSIFAERGPSYLMILVTTAGTLFIRRGLLMGPQEWTFHLSVAVVAGIVLETVKQLKALSRNHIRRLETITDFSRKITSTLDTKQVMALLNAAFQNAVEADTYFVGIREGNEMRLELIYDDGEYFENQRVSLDGSLSSWVLSNHESLFLPDLRKEVVLPGVRLVLLGKHKTSLSWMGVPMQNSFMDGIIAIGSYRPNAFDRADLELLTSLAQHAAQALQNTHDHEEVELRSKLDSLTGVYNHGAFLRLLQQQADQAVADRQLLSLIMLDIDHFKQYNDSYGHLVGDEVLTILCNTIRKHIKSTDFVGRWGGEEFVISLPNASAEQAEQVALRIRETMLRLAVRIGQEKTVPAPTVSQGLAVFPREAESIMPLIDLADHRLYIAKDRGRNQIEPEPTPQQMLILQEQDEQDPA